MVYERNEGDVFYQNYFMMFDDAFIPSQFDLTVPLVIPERKQTNFTYVESISKYVYTSFSDYQWDLNYKNPYVLIDMLKQLYTFSLWGIDKILLDAIPLMWKTIGTNCRNLPEVHVLMRLFRAFRDLTCPNVALLGEAIVEPHEIVKYFEQMKLLNVILCMMRFNCGFMAYCRDTRWTFINLMQIDSNY